jgi:16S rRNA (guanine527-N7)-methyltransferase
MTRSRARHGRENCGHDESSGPIPLSRAGASATDADLEADRARALRIVPVSRETIVRLDAFVALLLKWQQTTNLVAPSTLSHVWTRHIADSLQLLRLAPEARTWVDLGSGGGFPGLVLACALPEMGGRIQLIESNAKKSAFLREAARVLAVPALVHDARIKDFTASFDESVDVVTARALAPLDRLLTYAAPLLKSGAQGLFLKGRDVDAELTEAAKYWILDAGLVPSKTSAHGRIVVVRAATRR